MRRSAKDVKRALLKRAFAENRGAEVISLIQSRTNSVRVFCEESAKQAKEFDQNNYGQPRSVRMLNLLAEREGVNVRFSDNSRETASSAHKPVLN